jgi:hypothetical protein
VSGGEALLAIRMDIPKEKRMPKPKNDSSYAQDKKHQSFAGMQRTAILRWVFAGVRL